MMHKCIMVKIGGKRNVKKRKFNKNRGKCKNFARTGETIIEWETGRKCKNFAG